MKYLVFILGSLFAIIILLSTITANISPTLLNSVSGLCAATTRDTIEGTWISNDKTKNTVYQNTDAQGNVYIEWYGTTHDELGRTYSYTLDGILVDNRIEGTVTYGKLPGGVAQTYGPGYADMTLQLVTYKDSPTRILNIQKVPAYDEGDFASYKWTKECKDNIVIIEP
jgi:hypothetical protein